MYIKIASDNLHEESNEIEVKYKAYYSVDYSKTVLLEYENKKGNLSKQDIEYIKYIYENTEIGESLEIKEIYDLLVGEYDRNINRRNFIIVIVSSIVITVGITLTIIFIYRNKKSKRNK
jgi:major membrane immunogen (membrane-anchored lipoprotein)